MSRFRLTPAVLAVVLTLLISAPACVSVRNPEGWAAPEIAGDSAILLRSKDQLTAFNTFSGVPTIAWEFPTETQKKNAKQKIKAIYGEPIVNGGRIYFATYDGDVIAVDSNTGIEIWRRKHSDDGITGRLAIAGNALVFGTIEGRLWSLETSSGNPTSGWPPNGIKLPEGIWAPVIVEDSTAYVATIGGKVFAYNLANASPKWAKPFSVSGGIADLALAAPGRLFVPSLNKNVYLVDAATGQATTPPTRTSDWVWMKPAIKDSMAYFADFSGKVYSLNITTGQSEEIGQVAAKVKSSPVLVGNTLVLADRSRNIVFFDVAANKKLNTVLVGEKGTIRAGLSVSDGQVYALSTAGKVFRANPQELSVVEIFLPAARK